MSAKPWLVPSLLLAGCGYVGDPQPPSLNIPRPVEDLRAAQRADRVEIAFTIPKTTTDGVGLRLNAVELRAAPSDPGGDVDAWAANAETYAVSAAEPGEARHTVPVAPWAGKQIWMAARVASHKNKWSAWSNVVALDVVAAVEPPRELKAASDPQGVRLTWRFAEAREGRRVRISRKGPGEPAFTEVATASADAWVDATAQFGSTYEYSAEALVGEATSVRSGAVSVTPQDTFAPAPPKGLTAVAGIGSIELAWERGPEPDIAAYRVFRAAGGEALSQIGEQTVAPSFSDRNAATGATYRYAVAAVDRNGNVSAPCEPVAAAAP